MKYLTVQEIEYVAYRLAKELMTWDEPIPDFGTRFPTVLERCLALPRQTFDKRPLYKGLVAKASILFYVMVKDHPFQNGNKRIAVMTLLHLLYKNEQWLHISNQELYSFAKWVAESSPKVKEQTVAAIREIVRRHLVSQEI